MIDDGDQSTFLYLRCAALVGWSVRIGFIMTSIAVMIFLKVSSRNIPSAYILN